MRKRYTDEAKAEAIELATTVGRPEAARRTGIPAGTIGSWLTRAGLSNADPEGRRERIRVAHETWLQRRATLVDTLGELADAATLKLLAMVDDDQVRPADLAKAIAVAIDRAQLLSGDVTERVEAVVTRERRLEEARERSERHLHPVA